MYDEMRFLFDVDPNIKNKYNVGNKVVNDANPAQDVQFKEELDPISNNFTLKEYVVDKSNIKNYIANDINKLYNTTNSNPYLELLKEFNGTKTAKALKLKSSDFAYLRDIGVMPINRLVILRRYPEGVIVPVDLSDLDVEPISVVVGWVKKDTNLLNFSFNEEWQITTIPLHEMLAKIIKDEFGVDITAIAPIPGWGLGFLFGIMNRMGLTSYNKFNLPIGDPDLLKEAITRPHESFGLQSEFTIDLDTVYEQKYISGIDPTVSMMEILNNLLMMGTSDVKFLGIGGGKLLKELRDANEDPTNGRGWAKLTGDIVKGFTSALSYAISNIKDDFSKIFTAQTPPKVATGANPSGSTETQYNQKKNIGTAILDSGIVQSILASTVARYQWPLRGSISMFTGDPSTPWHLSIGNPYAPLLSMNNVYTRSVAVTYGKDMGLNDMPRTIEVKIQMKQGRNLGKQEIFSYFGVSYKRYYNKSNVQQKTTTTTTTAPA